MGAPDPADRELLRTAADGSEAAWHEFVSRYSGLIYSLICRYLVQPDEDERKSVYVDVLESLYEGGLARYDGRATVSTWVGVVTRSRCMDHLRREHGRHQSPGWLEGLSPGDRVVYRRFYVEGQGFREICSEDSGNEPTLSVQTLTEALDRIDAYLDRASRRRMAFELEARTVGGVSGRLLEYLEYARQQSEHARHVYAADSAVLEDDAQKLVGRLERAMSKLGEEERTVIRLRYREGLDARTVAGRMGLPSARRAYTISDRAVRKLRLMMGEEGAQS